jgi:Arc/MetJ-type ribon-helix-helix transcriptional regulator
MSYPFPPDLQQLVHDAMSTGGFQSEDELLRNALAAWKDRFDDQALRRSIEQMEVGEMRPFQDALRDICERHGLAQP